MNRMEPVPETAQVLNYLTEHGHEGMALALQGMARRTEAIVPECVGLSVGLVEEGLHFTVVASNGVVAAIDATQYADGGPCVEAAETGALLEARVQDLLDERRWLLFARASAAAGIASTLSLPLLSHGEVIGGVNLYASTSTAFEGRHEALAKALGGMVEGAVRNADLSFSTRQAAADMVPRFEDATDIEVAVGILMARQHMDMRSARARLRDAAARAGITEAQAARAIKHSYD